MLELKVPITLVHGEIIYAPVENPQPTVAGNWYKKLDDKPATQRRTQPQHQPRARIPVKKRTERLNPTSKCIVCNRNFTQVSLDFVPRRYLKHHNISQVGDDLIISCFSCSH